MGGRDLPDPRSELVNHEEVVSPHLGALTAHDDGHGKATLDRAEQLARPREGARLANRRRVIAIADRRMRLGAARGDPGAARPRTFSRSTPGA